MGTKPSWQLLIPVLFCVSAIVSTVSAGDHLQWGQKDSRNMVSAETGLADSFDPATGRNIKWSAGHGKLRHAGYSPGQGADRHEQRASPRSPSQGRSRRAALPGRKRRKSLLATHRSQTQTHALSGLAKVGPLLAGDRRRRKGICSDQPRRGCMSRPQRPGQRQRRAIPGRRPPHGTAGRRANGRRLFVYQHEQWP